MQCRPPGRTSRCGRRSCRGSPRRERWSEEVGPHLGQRIPAGQHLGALVDRVGDDALDSLQLGGLMRDPGSAPQPTPPVSAAILFVTAGWPGTARARRPPCRSVPSRYTAARHWRSCRVPRPRPHETSWRRRAPASGSCRPAPASSRPGAPRRARRSATPGGRAGEHDVVPALGELRAEPGPVADDDLEDPRRHARLEQQLHHPERGERRLGVRLEHHRVAGQERRDRVATPRYSG